MKIKFSLPNTLVTITAVFVMVVSCKNDTVEIIENNIFFEPVSQSSFHLDDPIERNLLARTLVKEEGEIKLLNDVRFMELSDRQGSFKAIVVNYEFNDKTSRLIVPLEQITDYPIKNKNQNETHYIASSCTLKCEAASGCSNCELIVIERCKIQTCNCPDTGGSCSVSVQISA